MQQPQMNALRLLFELFVLRILWNFTGPVKIVITNVVVFIFRKNIFYKLQRISGFQLKYFGVEHVQRWQREVDAVVLHIRAHIVFGQTESTPIFSERVPRFLIKHAVNAINRLFGQLELHIYLILTFFVLLSSFIILVSTEVNVIIFRCTLSYNSAFYNRGINFDVI